MRHFMNKTAWFSALALSAAVLTSCTTDKFVYRQVPSDVPVAAKSFVGYTDVASKQTGCGNCHVDQQIGWAGTKHSQAWADILASGAAASSCMSCHTVNSNGNTDTVSNVGYIATQDSRYQDVQCESCHGPGLDHMTAPAIANRPLASANVDTGKAITYGCGECHTGSHDPFVDEWKQTSTSGHAHLESAALSSTNVTCVTCHTAQGALGKFNVTTNYIERDSIKTKPLPVTCVVCHDPHAKNNDYQLRFAINTPDPTQNLCMQCHNRDGTPSPTSNRAPMTAETMTLLGTAGWFPPNLTISGVDTIIATHGSSANTNMCATCHVARSTVTDPSGKFVFQSTGHDFTATPCLDSLGRPTTGTCGFSQRSFAACAASGCHGSATVASSLFITDSIRVAQLQTTLSNMLKKAPTTALNYSVATMTTAKGANYNLLLSQKPGAWVHNPFLIMGLLSSSISQMTTDYGIPAASVVPSVNDILSNKKR